VKGLGYVGGLVGYNKGNVSNSYVTGEVSGVSFIGGLVGLSLEGDVKTSYATSDVSGMGWDVGGLVGLIQGPVSVSKSFAIGDVNGEEKVGGLVGHNKANIENSYASGDVNGEEIVGRLVGLNTARPGLGYTDMSPSATVKTSYASGEVTGEENVGGLVGLSESGDVTHSYWDIENSKIEESDGGTDLKTDEMTGENALYNMDGFDFNEIWETVEENHDDADEDGYPILQELDREQQLKAQDVYVEEEDEDGIPGFTSYLLLLAAIIAVGIYKKKP